MLHGDRLRHRCLVLLGIFLLLSTTVSASLGDHLPEFKSCLKTCVQTNCASGTANIPLLRRLLFWDCPAECDYACQHVVTDKRLARDPPYLEPILQFHGKWPFYRFLGMQEPASVLFSLFNFLAHYNGLARIKEQIPPSYPLRQYYVWLGYLGLVSWTFSMIFHTRDFIFTERLDYFGAGASVMYGLFYSPIRIFRLDQARTSISNTNNVGGTLLRLWTFVCVTLYFLHIFYLTFIDFDYTYNMAANVAVGIVHNLLWTWFAVTRFRKIGRLWAAWPGLIVAWVILAMSLELFDFPPWKGMLDAHALWHLGTVIPTIWWYSFLIKDAQEDLLTARLKA